VNGLQDLVLGLKETPTCLVVVLHGWGDEGKDIAPFADIFVRLMPFAVFHLPTAPFPCDDGRGFDWLGENGVRSSAPLLDAFLDRTMSKYRLDDSRTLLVGMAEGMMAGLHVGLRRARPLAGIVGFCGMMAEADSLATEIKSRPPVFLAHGDQDAVIPMSIFEHTAKALRDNGVQAEVHIAKGVGHTVDRASITHAWRFMYRAMDLPGLQS
jgi:phospholipase/carboxylesterase